MEAKSKRAGISEPLLPPPVGNEFLLPPMMSQGYKSATDHEEEEDSEDNAVRPGKDYRPPNASRSCSGSMSRLPPRAANPTLDFGTARKQIRNSWSLHEFLAFCTSLDCVIP